MGVVEGGGWSVDVYSSGVSLIFVFICGILYFICCNWTGIDVLSYGN